MHTPDDVVAKLKSYQPSARAKKLIETTPIMLLVGISGAGKDTIERRLLQDWPGQYHSIITCTTRAPRENNGILEVDGVNYHFLTWQQAEGMLDRQEFIETNLYAGNFYGSSINEIHRAKQQGKMAIGDIDMNGVRHYKALSPNVKAVFLLPPSFEIWQARYFRRYEGTHAGLASDVKRRMQTAIVELDTALTSHFYQFVINDDLDQTVNLVHAIAHNQTTDQKMPEQLVHQLIVAMHEALEKLS